MEIKPYRSQVRETPTPEPTSNRINTVGAQSYAGWGNLISQAGQNTASSMYKLNEVMQKKRAADDDMAYRAICQDIDEAFLNFGNQTAEFFQNDANDPSKVFYEDKSTYDKFYQDGINSIQINTIDKVKNPRVQEAARLYFNEKRMQAGQGFLNAYNENKKNAEAVVFGRELDDKVQSAIFANYDKGDTPEAHMADIESTLKDMASRGVIRQDEIKDYVKNAEQRILYGRARNIISNLDYMAGKKYLQQMTKDKTLDDKTRASVESYFNEYWRHEADMRNQTAADTYAKDLENIENLSEEDIRNNPAYKQMPQIGVNNNYADTLIGIKKKREDHDKAERQNGQVEFYFQQLYNPESEMYGNYDAIEKSVMDDPDLDTKQKEDILKSVKGFKKVKDNEKYLNTYKKYYNYKFGNGNYDPEAHLAELNKDLESGEIDQQSAEHWANIFNNDINSAQKAAGKDGTEWGDDYYESHMAEYYQILTSEYAENKTQKMKLFGEFCANYYVPPEKYNTLRTAVLNSYMNPRLGSLAEMLDEGMADAKKKKDTAKYDRFKAIQGSLFEAIFTDTSSPDGKLLSKPDRERKIELALDTVQKFIDGERLDDLASQQLWPNRPVFEPAGNRGYTVDIGTDWTTSRTEAERASLLRYTDEGRAVFDQFKSVCGEMISGATGEYESLGNPIFIDDEVRFESGVKYYKGEDGKTRRYVNKIYTIKLVDGNVNIFETRHEGKGEKTELKVPYIIKRQWAVDEEELKDFQAYREDVKAKNTPDIDIEKADKAYETSPDWFKTGMAEYEYKRRHSK